MRSTKIHSNKRIWELAEQEKNEPNTLKVR